MPQLKWILIDDVQPLDALRLVLPGRAHGVLLFWKDGKFLNWYINLEEPLRRTSIGFDYMDQLLDIVVSPDLSECRWKDEDELEEGQSRGLISRQKATEIRAEGERVIELIRARKPPFNQGWEHWKPDPSWPIPQLPEKWEVI